MRAQYLIRVTHKPNHQSAFNHNWTPVDSTMVARLTADGPEMMEDLKRRKYIRQITLISLATLEIVCYSSGSETNVSSTHLTLTGE